MRYQIHVNRQFIAFNNKAGEPVLPTYIVREGFKRPIYGYGVKVLGASELVDPRSAGKLSCGAKAWIETEGPIVITGPMDFQKADAIRKAHKG